MRQVILLILGLSFYSSAQIPFLIQGRPADLEVTSFWTEKLLNLQSNKSEKSVFITDISTDPKVGVTAFKVANRIFLPKTRGNIDYTNFSYQVTNIDNQKEYEVFNIVKGI